MIFFFEWSKYSIQNEYRMKIKMSFQVWLFLSITTQTHITPKLSLTEIFFYMNLMKLHQIKRLKNTFCVLHRLLKNTDCVILCYRLSCCPVFVWIVISREPSGSRLILLSWMRAVSHHILHFVSANDIILFWALGWLRCSRSCI